MIWRSIGASIYLETHITSNREHVNMLNQLNIAKVITDLRAYVNVNAFNNTMSQNQIEIKLWSKKYTICRQTVQMI